MRDPFARIEKRDLILYHPNDDYAAVVRFLEAAARDREVDQVRMTMYRIGRDNALAQLLIEAAEAGKDVAVFLEGRARFDELDNLYWKLRFQAAGVRMMPYPPRKVHAKALYVRRAGRGFLHLGTGNYNPANASLYTDLSLFTADRALTLDAAEFFAALDDERLPDLQVMRYGGAARDDMIALIRAECHEQGHVILKVNHLTDPAVLTALREAAEAGARVDLIVRSSLTLLHEAFHMRSLIGRHLEHARVVAFRNGGDWLVWAGSADWMARNFDRRLELLFPLLDVKARARALKILRRQLHDDRNAFLLLADGSHRPIWGGEHDAQTAWL
jgi:polyphosphate kinase